MVFQVQPANRMLPTLAWDEARDCVCLSIMSLAHLLNLCFRGRRRAFDPLEWRCPGRVARVPVPFEDGHAYCIRANQGCQQRLVEDYRGLDV
jgi:hypothetical protein